MKKNFLTTTLILGILTAIFIGVYFALRTELFLTLSISFATTFYHFFIRFLIGPIVTTIFKKHPKLCEKNWFNVSSFEQKFYSKLKVRRWKKYVPTYDKSQFDLTANSTEQIIKNMCDAEAVHEVIIIFAFLPIIATIWFGALEVFVITSIISAIIDTFFVVVQRYNRPRIIRFLNSKKHN